MTGPTGDGFDTWGIVEVMGHKKFSGRITEQVIASASFVRCDVPAVTTRDGKRIPEYSKLIGAGSIYMITPTTEEVARNAAVVIAAYDSNPLPVYIPDSRQLPATIEPDERDDDSDDDDRDSAL